MSASPWLTSPLKRCIDVVIAGVAVALASPVLAVTALAVRLRLGSPVLFRQERAGRHARPIEIVKFRSMTDARAADGTVLDDDQRLPRFGRLLRASSLDELPQLLTVLRGDMSLIGPRPLPMKYVDRYDREQRRRLDAVPGITGWAQVQGRNALDWPTKLAHDVWYVDHASLRVDLSILLRTVRAVIARDGVSATGHATMPEFLGTVTAGGTVGAMPTDDTPFAGDATPLGIDDVEIAIFEGEAVLFDAGASMVHLLDGIAGAVWLLCDGETTVDQMVVELTDLFGVADDDVATLHDTVLDVLGRFAGERLLVGPTDSFSVQFEADPQYADDGSEVFATPPEP